MGDFFLPMVSSVIQSVRMKTKVIGPSLEILNRRLLYTSSDTTYNLNDAPTYSCNGSTRTYILILQQLLHGPIDCCSLCVENEKRTASCRDFRHDFGGKGVVPCGGRSYKTTLLDSFGPICHGRQPQGTTPLQSKSQRKSW